MTRLQYWLTVFILWASGVGFGVALDRLVGAHP